MLVVAAMSCLAYFGIYYYDSYKAQQLSAQLTEKKNDAAVNRMYGQTQTVQENADGQQITLTVLDEYKSLYNQNKNLIGWLEIADTNIDYPVMQTADNEYYLDHNINQEEDKNGTLFLDSACDVVKPSTNFIIYGHNMRSGNMFGNLDKYKSESYYKDHPMIRFDTIYEKVLIRSCMRLCPIFIKRMRSHLSIISLSTLHQSRNLIPICEACRKWHCTIPA